MDIFIYVSLSGFMSDHRFKVLNKILGFCFLPELYFELSKFFLNFDFEFSIPILHLC